MPEGRGHHVLDAALLTVGQFHFGFLFLGTDAADLSAGIARLLRAFARTLAALVTGLRRLGHASARVLPTLRTWLVCCRRTIPIGVLEFEVGLHEVVDREVIFAVVEPRPTSDDLLELDHRVDRTHKNDVADIPGIHSRRELLGCGQDGWDRFFVILEVAEILFAQSTIIRRDTLAVIRILAGVELVDEVAHDERVGLVCAEN